MKPDDIDALDRAFDSNENEARALVRRLDERDGARRVRAGTWSIAECLDHLAISNRVYLGAMQPAATRALAEGRTRRGPATPGMVGRWFVRSLEPPVGRRKLRAPRSIQPRVSPPVVDAMEAFLGSQSDVRAFLRTYSEIDLAGVMFPNPFIRGVRFSVATGLHVIAAHQRRHLWQAWRVRRAVQDVEAPACVS